MCLPCHFTGKAALAILIQSHMYKGSENIYHPTKLYKHIHRCVYMISKSMARRLSEAFLVFMPSGLLSMSDSISLPLVYSSHSPVSLIGDLSASSCYSPSLIQPPLVSLLIHFPSCLLNSFAYLSMESSIDLLFCFYLEVYLFISTISMILQKQAFCVTY